MTNKEFLESITLEGEEWRDVVGYEGLYVVSNMGRIVFLHRIVSNGKSVREISPKLCKFTINTDGYAIVHIHVNNKVLRRLVHRVVADAFIHNPENNPEVDHINTLRYDNRAENLRWVTSSENSNNPITLKRNKDVGLKFGKPIVKVKSGLIVEYYPSIKSAKKAGYNEQTIYRSLNGQPLPTKDYIWMYISDYKSSYQ